MFSTKLIERDIYCKLSYFNYPFIYVHVCIDKMYITFEMSERTFTVMVLSFSLENGKKKYLIIHIKTLFKLQETVA